MTTFEAVLTLALDLAPHEREQLVAELLRSLSVGATGPAPAMDSKRVEPLLAAMQAGLAELAAMDEFDETWDGLDDA